MRSRTIPKVLALVTLLVFTAGTFGCYGSFNLTRALYKFNGEVKAGDNKQLSGAVQSVIMILLSPIYGLATLADALIINSIEFWTGKNPMQANAEPTIRTVQVGSDRYVQTFTQAAGAKEMRIEYSRDGRHVNTLVVRQEENSPTVTADLRWSDGRHEVYQVTFAGAVTYRIAHTDSVGAHREWIASDAQVADISNRVENLLSPIALAGASTAPLFE
jgi:hypothetical protein